MPKKLTHDEAAKRLRAACISWQSSGNCADRDNNRCTSFEQINELTIDGLIAFKRGSGLDVVVTGATETGHSTKGERTHWNGYKIDIKVGTAVDAYITKTFERRGSRPGKHGGPQYYDEHGNEYVKESTPPHWDITYLSAPKSSPLAGLRTRWRWGSGSVALEPEADALAVFPGRTLPPFVGVGAGRRPDKDARVWKEVPDGPVSAAAVHTFVETHRTDEYVELLDASRSQGEGGIYLRLYSCRGELRVGTRNGWAAWQRGGWK